MDEGESIGAGRGRRGHLTLVHNQPGPPTAARLIERARAQRLRATRMGGKAEGDFDPSVYSQALGDLIIAAGGKVPGRVVFAPATELLTAGTFVAGLASHARRIGLAVLASEVITSGGRTALRWCDAPGVDRADPEPLALDLFNPRWPEDFTNWRERTARFADMVVVAAPALDRSVEGALIASEFDGIVILAHRAVSAREAIEDAIRRCRSVHARLFGIALIDGAAPSWLRLTAAAGGPSTPAGN